MSRLPQIVSVSRGAGGVVLQLVVPDDLVYFEGHFDGHPILPGIVAVDWAFALGCEHLALGATRVAGAQLKFARPIGPGARLTLTIERAPTPRTVLAFSYDADGAVAATGRLELDAA